MLKVLSRSDVGAQGALEVDLLLWDDVLCGSVEKIRLAKGGSVLCCSDAEGKLSLKHISQRSSTRHTLNHTHTQFCWEDLSEHRRDVNPKLLAVDSHCNLRLYQMDPQDRVALVCEGPSDTLLESVKDTQPDAAELRTVKPLSFSDGLCVLLVNACVLVKVGWSEESSRLETLCSCRLSLPLEMQEACVDHQLCCGLLFALLWTGLTYVFDSTDGKLVATVDFPSYCGAGQTDADASPPDSFCLLQVSRDLGTAVTVTGQNRALAVDLHHYFRMFPDHLCCRAAPSRPFLRPLESWDQDGLSSSAHSLSVLDTHFQTDRSWESRLSSLYGRCKARDGPAHGLPWYRHLPPAECRRAAAAAKLSRPAVKPGGAVMRFNVPESAAAAALSVSEFSAVLTFVSPGNRNTVLAYWDLEGESVTYHQADAPAVPVRRSPGDHLCLLLKGSGLSAVLFCVTQEELLNRLMIFGTAGTVDSLCHLNAWGRCSIPIHALQAGLKNHQLDTVDFFLKSKENILSPASGFGPSDQTPAVSSQSQLRSETPSSLT